MKRQKRRLAKVVDIGGCRIGGHHPVVIQGMVKVKTSRASEVIKEARGLVEAGARIVRVAVKDHDDVHALSIIKRDLETALVADIHFDYHLALLAIEAGVDKVRINPGNISRLDQIREIVHAALARRIPIRIGVNSGSLPASLRKKPEPQAMVGFALRYIHLLENMGFRDMVVSLKSSSLISTIQAYRLLAAEVVYPLHLGVTATGVGLGAMVRSALGIGVLLLEGIGDTLRVSLTSSSREEVLLARQILEETGMAVSPYRLISCPTCGRCQVDLVRIAERLEKGLRTSMVHGPWTMDKRNYGLSTTDHGQRPIKIAVMGCEVNGPGEAREADVGVALGKNGGLLFKKGRAVQRIRTSELIRRVLEEVEGI